MPSHQCVRMVFPYPLTIAPFQRLFEEFLERMHLSVDFFDITQHMVVRHMVVQFRVAGLGQSNSIVEEASTSFITRSPPFTFTILDVHHP